MTADIWSAGISKYWSVLHLNTTIEGYYKLMHNVTEFDNLLVRQAASEAGITGTN